MNKEYAYGRVRLRIEEILRAKNISKNQVCRDLRLPRTNLNRYCRGDFQRIDAELICKLCCYLEISPGDLIEYERPPLPE